MIISRSGQHVAQKAFSKHKDLQTGLFFLERDLVVYILNLVKVFGRYLDLETKMCTRRFSCLGKLTNSKEKTY